jgi:hypothetical protein
MRVLALCVTLAATVILAATAGAGGPPKYEPAYFGGHTVTINAMEVPFSEGALVHASAEIYIVIYPKVALDAGLVPQCNPCDHGNGPTFHDHVLDSVPGDPGAGEFSPLWHIMVIRPNYTADPAHNAAVNAAYVSRLPLTSEQAVDEFVAAGYAVEVDTGHYFLCSVVDEHASR